MGDVDDIVFCDFRCFRTSFRTAFQKTAHRFGRFNPVIVSDVRVNLDCCMRILMTEKCLYLFLREQALQEYLPLCDADRAGAFLQIRIAAETFR